MYTEQQLKAQLANSKRSRENLSKSFLIVPLIVFCFESFSQDQLGVIVRPTVIFSKKAYKIFYPTILGDALLDSLVISDALQNIQDCFAQRVGNKLTVVYSSNGTNKVTHGTTLSFEKYVLNEGKFKMDNHAILHYASNIDIRGFSYTFFNDRIEFRCKSNPLIVVEYKNLFEFNSMRELKTLIGTDLTKSRCPNTL